VLAYLRMGTNDERTGATSPPEIGAKDGNPPPKRARKIFLNVSENKASDRKLSLIQSKGRWWQKSRGDGTTSPSESGVRDDNANCPLPQI